ncbi:MAG: helix-turn-helix transcriptional regulator [Planctomycetota bacterium]|nr:helix-turn-helix transcriptional regulator [Planctomycetota bacterium]
MKRKAARTSDGLKILQHRYYAGKPRSLAALEQARLEDGVARTIQELRRKAGLSQRELAARIGTTASVISRLEAADYESHSLSMLKRIAQALNKRLEVKFVDVRRSRTA